MKIPKFLDDLSVISKLGDNPGADNGLTAEGLKAKFDEAGLKLQTFLNETLIEKINSLFSLDAPPHEGMNMTGPINMNKNKLGGLADPAEDGDAVNLKFANENYRAADWMPTAEQVGARSNTWLPTINEIGAAPSGYGLGRSAVSIPSGDDLNNYKVGGWYQFTKGVANAPFDYGMMLIIHGANYANDTFQYAFSRYPANNMAIRQLFDGSWGEWEWINPPMVVGTEYRTTERWQGQAVYTTIINFGNMPNNSTASVSIANLKATGILSCRGVTNKGDTIPYSWSGEYMTEVSATVNNIYLYTRTNVSDSIAYITLKYIKA